MKKTQTVHYQVTNIQHMLFILLILFSVYKCLFIFLSLEIQRKTTILCEKRGKFLIWITPFFVKHNFSFSNLKCYFTSPHLIIFSPPLIMSFHPQELVELISSNRVLVVSGETGCGKTTQVTQFILDDYINRGLGSMCRVVCTQPRRISAISVCSLLLCLTVLDRMLPSGSWGYTVCCC